MRARLVGEVVHGLAAFYPWLVSEWHPTANELRPDQVTRASAREQLIYRGRAEGWLLVPSLEPL